MTFERNFKLSSFCVIGSGFGAIALTGIVHWLPVSLFISAFVFSFFANTDKLRRRIPMWVLNCLVIAYVLIFILEVVVLSHSLLVSLAHLVFFTAGTKLLTLSKNRDYFFLYLTSFAVLLAASVFSADFVFALCFLIFLFSGIHTFILFEMQRSSTLMHTVTLKSTPEPGKEQSAVSGIFKAACPALLMFAVSAGTAFCVLMLALPLFLLLPRTASSHHRSPSGDKQFVSGFSDRVELGREGSIRQSANVVMRIRTSLPADQMPADIKWRGLAFDHYDGRVWERSDPVRHPVPIREGHFKLEDYAIGTDWLYQTFFLESLSTDVIFTARKALAVSRDVEFLARDSYDNLYTVRDPGKKMRYTALSDLSRPNPDFISDTIPIPEEIRRSCLQLPSFDVKIMQLAEHVTEDSSNGYEKARKLEQYLREEYAYSLELTGTDGSEDPVSVFLFKNGSGHCEYFASAMTIMLRYLGIPSRLVNGFRGGEYNRIGNDWIVRQYHAHSWTEAYLPPYGWMEFDPTPVLHPPHATAFARFWSGLADAADLWWWEHIVHYDSISQNSVVSGIYSASGGIRDSVYALLRHAYVKSRNVMAAVSDPKRLHLERGIGYLSIPAIILIFMWIRPIRKKALALLWPVLYRNRPQKYAEKFYDEALEMLSNHGMKRAPEVTPMEFARSLAPHPSAGPLTALTRLYNGIRFGPADRVLPLKEAEELLQSLRISLKQ